MPSFRLDRTSEDIDVYKRQILIIVAYEAFDPPNDQRYQENRQHDQTAKGDDPVAPNLASSVTSDFFLFHLFFAFPRRNARRLYSKGILRPSGRKNKKNPMGFSQPYNSAPPFFCNKKGEYFLLAGMRKPIDDYGRSLRRCRLIDGMNGICYDNCISLRGETAGRKEWEEWMQWNKGSFR